VPKAANQKWIRDFATEGRLQPQHDISDQKDRLITVLATEGAVFSGKLIGLELQLAKADGIEPLRKLFLRQSHGALPQQASPRNFRREGLANLPIYHPATIPQPKQASLYFDTLPQLALFRIDPTYHEFIPAPKSPDTHRINIVRQLQAAFDADIAPKSGSELSGRLWAVDWAKSLDGEEREFLIKFARQAADLAFDKNGQPLKEPPFHNQMSDAVFMNGPILTGVGTLTGEKKYFDACAQHQAFIRELCRRDDNLYRHSPLCEAAWGRGNGFVALGHALMLEDLPEDHPARKEILAAYQSHMAALKQHQDYTGMWHQVIDRPESYREFSSTCMIGFAMARGIRGGWLDKETYQPCVERAWRAIAIRSLPDGRYVDVCTGTGKQKTLRDYYDREAILGKDSRAISMSWMFASEVLR
jgi:rhamnogalacturonyl hydrolase YesR